MQLENTEGTIKNGQSRETGNIGLTRFSKTKQINTTQYVLDTINNYKISVYFIAGHFC
jgi:hypothetical protein